jgi:glycosyltransferase involved in cell wall biosynthesis
MTDPGAGPDERPSLLYVATISATLRHFMGPYARHLRSNGWRVEAAAHGADDDNALRAAFDDVHELPLSRSILDVLGMVAGYRAIARLLSAAPDIVHVHTPIASFLTRLAVRRRPAASRPKVVYTAHGFHFHRQGRWITNLLFRTAERLAGRWTDRLIVINDEDDWAARRHRIVPTSRLVRMPGVGLDTTYYSRAAVDPTAVANLRTAFGAADGAAMFVAVGELNRNKRHTDAIAALAAMRRRDAVLLLVGDGEARSRLERLASQLGVEDRVVITGFVTDVRPILVGATALIHPSQREGLSRSVMEALALEVPVVASTARGNAELVRDSGAIVAIGDVVGLASAMDRLAERTVEARDMGQRGRERMVNRYDLDALIAQHERLYADLVQERGPTRPRP